MALYIVFLCTHLKNCRILKIVVPEPVFSNHFEVRQTCKFETPEISDL